VPRPKNDVILSQWYHVMYMVFEKCVCLCQTHSSTYVIKSDFDG